MSKVEMKFLLAHFVYLLLCTLGFVAADLTADFKQTEVVPDGLNQAPQELLTVKYDGKAVKFNEDCTPTSMKHQPEVVWKSDASSYYTVIMTDLDAPKHSHPTFREMLHWLVTNIPGNDFSQAHTIVEYVPSAPQIHTGKHRVLYTLYKQPGKLEFDEPHSHSRSLVMRLRFSQRDFSKKYNMGEPIAANLVLVEYDDYVPTLHKEFLRISSSD